MTSNNTFTFNLEPYDLYGSFYESVVGLELARRGLHHTFYGCFGYMPKLPEVLEPKRVDCVGTRSQGQSSARSARVGQRSGRNKVYENPRNASVYRGVGIFRWPGRGEAVPFHLGKASTTRNYEIARRHGQRQFLERGLGAWRVQAQARVADYASSSMAGDSRQLSRAREAGARRYDETYRVSYASVAADAMAWSARHG